MKTKLKIFAASTALSLLLLNGCYAKIEIKRSQHKELQQNEVVKKYEHLLDQIIKYEKLVSGKDYTEGKIIINFDKEITKEEANKFIENQDITNKLEMLSYNRKLKQAVVKVPKEQEKSYALWFQNMSDETIVDYTELDFITEIQN